jgi:hypothetical protein
MRAAAAIPTALIACEGGVTPRADNVPAGLPEAAHWTRAFQTGRLGSFLEKLGTGLAVRVEGAGSDHAGSAMTATARVQGNRGTDHSIWEFNHVATSCIISSFLHVGVFVVVGLGR